MKTTIIIGMLGIMLMSTSCKKYNDGPEISLRSKSERVANNWQVAKATQDGNDVTDKYQDYQYYFTKSGSATLRTIDRGISGASEHFSYGTWVFVEEKEKIYLNLSDDQYDATFTIKKLYENEMWLKNDANGVELHLIPL